MVLIIQLYKTAGTCTVKPSAYTCTCTCYSALPDCIVGYENVISVPFRVFGTHKIVAQTKNFELILTFVE